jgi:hypothetical protein
MVRQALNGPDFRDDCLQIKEIPGTGDGGTADGIARKPRKKALSSPMNSAGDRPGMLRASPNSKFFAPGVINPIVIPIENTKVGSAMGKGGSPPPNRLLWRLAG